MSKLEPSTFTIHGAKAHLSQLIARVEAGEEMIIAQGEKPVVRLIPVEQPKPKREFGKWSHLIGGVRTEFFDPPPDEEVDAWKGKHTDAHGIARPEKE